jgi:hypothetical protein
MNVGVSDFIVVAQIAERIIHSWRHAREEYRAFADEVDSLALLLNEYHPHKFLQLLTSSERRKLNLLTLRCKNILEELEKEIEKFDALRRKKDGSCKTNPLGV